MISPAYVTDIPQDAEARVASRHPGGTPDRVEYVVAGQVVGYRQFDLAGQIALEIPVRHGVRHGTEYRWWECGYLLSAEPYVDGKPHGAAHQWEVGGGLLGSYTMDHGNGWDLWWDRRENGSRVLVEARRLVDGDWDGFEWWINDDQQTVYIERHWRRWRKHGIEREWNVAGRLSRGFPRYWVAGEHVVRRVYLRAAKADHSLPPFAEADNLPSRTFPDEVRAHLGPLPDSGHATPSPSGS